MKLIIYFNNEKHIVVDRNKLLFTTAEQVTQSYGVVLDEALANGKVPIIIDNVCFIKEYKPKEEALDD